MKQIIEKSVEVFFKLFFERIPQKKYEGIPRAVSILQKVPEWISQIFFKRVPGGISIEISGSFFDRNLNFQKSKHRESLGINPWKIVLKNA